MKTKSIHYSNNNGYYIRIVNEILINALFGYTWLENSAAWKIEYFGKKCTHYNRIHDTIMNKQAFYLRNENKTNVQKKMYANRFQFIINDCLGF